MKVAHIAPYYYPSIGGVQAVAQYVSEELAKRGHEVTVLTTNHDHFGKLSSEYPKQQMINGVLVKRFQPIIKIGHMSVCPGLILDLLREPYDAIHFHNYRHPHSDIASLIARFRKMIFVMHGHGPFYDVPWLKQVLYDVYDFFAGFTLYKRIHKFICITPFEKEQYIKWGADPEDIAIIPNAASDDCFQTVDPKPFIQKYQLEDKKLILFLGVINDFKKPHLLIEALPDILSRVPEAMVIYVGPDGGMLSTIQERARTLNMTDHYRWIGPLYGKEKIQAISAAELLALPSDNESFGLVVVEAMAQAKPVIGTFETGIADIVDHEKNGYLIKKRDVKALSTYVIQLLTRPDLLRQFGDNGRRKAIERYSVSGTVDQMEQFYSPNE